MAKRGSPKPPAAEIVNGVPALTDWNSPPGDGALFVTSDTASPTLYAKVNGEIVKMSGAGSVLFAEALVISSGISGGSVATQPLGGVQTGFGNQCGALTGIVKVGAGGSIARVVLMPPPFSAGSLICNNLEVDVSSLDGTQRLSRTNHVNLPLVSDIIYDVQGADLPDDVEVPVGADISLDSTGHFKSAIGGLFLVALYARFTPTDLAA